MDPLYALFYRALLIIVLSNAVGRAAAIEPAKERDLSTYDLAGPYSLSMSFRHREEESIITGMLRKFLWTRWQRHRLAHVAVVEYSIEGIPTRSWYFIEPDQRGRWRVLINVDITYSLPKPGSDDEPIRKSQRFEAYSLERVDLRTDNDESNRKAINDKEARDPEQYRLLLKNASGEIIREI